MYLITLSGILNDNIYICKDIIQYHFDEERPLFTYKNYIEVNRIITKEEAKKLYELIPANSNLCAGKPLTKVKL